MYRTDENQAARLASIREGDLHRYKKHLTTCSTCCKAKARHELCADGKLYFAACASHAGAARDEKD